MHIIAFSFECGGFDNRLMRGGLSPLVWNLCREYAARGHRVPLESGGNRTATVPSNGEITVNDTWRG
ncbi:hypothetical protein ABZZ79_34635 [Streptomyces sp. NPDC006458]|uniref:hypothetical protein n=1 Tax=Streptomyces sp. NPDC006458 TaxID=3154302 RepID=UPI0033BE2DC9